MASPAHDYLNHTHTQTNKQKKDCVTISVAAEKFLQTISKCLIYVLVDQFYSRNSLGISRTLQPECKSTHLSIQIVAWGESPELPEFPIWRVPGACSHFAVEELHRAPISNQSAVKPAHYLTKAND